MQFAGAVQCYNSLQTIAPDIEHENIFVKALIDPKYNPQGQGRTENCNGVSVVYVLPNSCRFVRPPKSSDVILCD